MLGSIELPYEIVELREAPRGVAATVQTDDRGAFHFPSILAGQYTLETWPLRCYRVSQSFKVDGTKDVDLGVLQVRPTDTDVSHDCGGAYPWDIDCRTRKTSISGTVVSKSGVPVRNAIVRVGGKCSTAFVTTDANGTFRFGRAPEQGIEFGIAVKAPGLQPTCFGPFKLGKASKDFVTGTLPMDEFVPESNSKK